jgi:hypothetical protein
MLIALKYLINSTSRVIEGVEQLKLLCLGLEYCQHSLGNIPSQLLNARVVKHGIVQASGIELTRIEVSLEHIR